MATQEESRDKLGLRTVRYFRRCRECGHAQRLDAPAGPSCPQCDDYAEAFSQDVLDAVFVDDA